MQITEQMVLELARTVVFPPLTLVSTPPDVAANPKLGALRPDLIVQAKWQGKQQLFAAKVKAQSVPQALLAAIQQSRTQAAALNARRASQSPAYQPLVIVPYLKPETLDRLAAEQVSGFDLVGNGVIVVPGEWLIYRTGGVNHYPTSTPIRNVFRGTSSLVPRVFLLRPTFSSVKEVLDEITARDGQITLPTVSKVLKTLQEELIVGRNEGIRLLDARRLLELLATNYRAPQIRCRWRGKLCDPQEGLTKMFRRANETPTRTVIEDPTRYTILPSAGQALTIWTESIEQLLQGVDGTETARFPTIELCESDDPTLYFDSRREGHIAWSSPLQVWLALQAGGKREQEAASELAKDLIHSRVGALAKI